MKYMLPQENDFEYESDSMTLNSRRTTPASLAEMEQTLPNSASKIQLPAGVLDYSTLSTGDTSSFLDVRLIEYPPVEGPQGTLAKVIDYEILEVGIYQNNDVNYYLEPVPVNITQVDTPIEITIEVSNIHPEFSPFCVYATSYNETSGDTTWSKEGCELESVSTTEGTVLCKCTHLSRFTAGEDLITVEPEPVVVVEEDDDDGSKTTTFPIMILFLGILLLAIIISAVSERIKRRQEFLRINQSSISLQSPHPMGKPVKEINPVIRIGDECKFDDSLFEFVDRTFARSKLGSRTDHYGDETGENQITPDVVSPAGLLSVPAGKTDRQQRTNYDTRNVDIWPSPSRTERVKDVLDTDSQAKDIWPHMPSPAKETEPETSKQQGPRKGNNDTTMDMGDFVEDRSCCGKHLVCGATRPWPNAVNRSLLVCGSLIMEITMIGVVYYSQYEVSESHTNDFSLDELELIREVGIGSFAAAAGISISCVLTIIHGKKESSGIFLSSLFVLVNTVITCYLSVIFNEIWSLTWMVSWLIAAMAELIIGQTILMVVAGAIFKRNKPS